MGPVREIKGATGVRTAPEHRAFLVHEYKATNDNAGLFEGYVAVFENLDQNGDVIDRGAFTKTLKEAREVKERTKGQYLFPILWQHNEKEPIGGFLEAHEDDHGLFVRGQFDVDTELGARAYSGAKKGYLRGLSIGYDTVKSIYDVKKRRHLLEIRLWEGSPVTFPANVEAQITDVKTATGRTDWPLESRTAAWDGGAASKALVEWAGGADDFDQAKMKSTHFYVDNSAPDKLGSYKLPFCDVVGGEVKAVPKGIFAVAGVLSGARGGADLGGDADAIKGKVATYYKRMAETFDDDSIQVPWSAKAQNLSVRQELKDVTGLAAFTGCAQFLDSIANGAEPYVDALAESIGKSLYGEGDIERIAPAVKAMLAGVDGLEGSAMAVIKAWQEFATQAATFLVAIGLPSIDQVDAAVPMHMSQLRSVFELKAGRSLSATNRQRLEKAYNGIMGHAEELKAMLKDNDANLADDEHTNAPDYGDVIASGHHNQPKSRRDRTGLEPARTTPLSSALLEPDDESTLSEMQAALLAQSLDLMGIKNPGA